MCVRNGALVNGMGVSKPVGVLLSGLGCYFAGWSVSKRDGLFLSKMGCY